MYTHKEVFVHILYFQAILQLWFSCPFKLGCVSKELFPLRLWYYFLHIAEQSWPNSTQNNFDQLIITVAKMQHVYKFLLLLNCNLRSKYFMIYKRFFTLVFILAWVSDHWLQLRNQTNQTTGSWLSSRLTSMYQKLCILHKINDNNGEFTECFQRLKVLKNMMQHINTNQQHKNTIMNILIYTKHSETYPLV